MVLPVSGGYDFLLVVVVVVESMVYASALKEKYKTLSFYNRQWMPSKISNQFKRQEKIMLQFWSMKPHLTGNVL